MNKRHINFYCNLSLLFFCNINGTQQMETPDDREQMLLHALNGNITCYCMLLMVILHVTACS
jgi:hypothetical protein